MSDTTYNIWQKSTEDGYNAAPGLVPWLSPEQNAMRERTRQAGMLFRGEHRKYFITEGRSQFEPQLVRLSQAFRQIGLAITNTGIQALYVPFNLLGLISKKGAGLLFGDAPKISCSETATQLEIDAIIKRSELHRLLLEGAIESSWAGFTYLEIVRQGGKAYVTRPAVGEIFPIGRRGVDGQYQQYVRFATANIGTKEAPITLLMKTTWSAGKIERQCFQVDGDKQTAVAFESWPEKQPDGTPWPESEPTGLDVPSIVWVPNEIVDGCAISDYDGAIHLQDSLNAKNSQVAYVLFKHANPKLAAPESKADESGNLPASAEVYFFRSKDEIPQYITWSAELDAANADRLWTVNALCMACEMSQVLLGLKEGAAPDSARKLILESTNSLDRANRKAVYWKSAIVRALQIAYVMEFGGPFKILAPEIAVEIRNGLPTDALDTANEIATLRSAQVLSVEGALEMRGLDQAAREKEKQNLKDESAGATPSVLMGEPATSPANNQNNVPNTEVGQ